MEPFDKMEVDRFYKLAEKLTPIANLVTERPGALPKMIEDTGIVSACTIVHYCPELGRMQMAQYAIVAGNRFIKADWLPTDSGKVQVRGGLKTTDVVFAVPEYHTQFVDRIGDLCREHVGDFVRVEWLDAFGMVFGVAKRAIADDNAKRALDELGSLAASPPDLPAQTELSVPPDKELVENATIATIRDSEGLTVVINADELVGEDSAAHTPLTDEERLEMDATLARDGEKFAPTKKRRKANEDAAKRGSVEEKKN